MKVEEDAVDAIAGMKVLIVEDNELNRDIMQEVLKERGLVVTEAADGQIAVDLFGSSPPGTFAARSLTLVSEQSRERSASRVPSARSFPLESRP